MMAGSSCRSCAVAAAFLTGYLLTSAALAEAVSATIFVPRTVIYPGDELSEINLVERKVSGDAQVAARAGPRLDDIVGKVARRTLVPGQVIPASALRSKEIVFQGRAYDVIYRSGVLTIIGTAVPLQSGSAGETVNVRNPETGAVFKAMVQAGGTLVVNTP
jgi:flagellar basal body P-ring formation protein FlgA